MQKNRITILGSGTSTGVPTTGCSCSICQEALHNCHSRNNRLRTSILLTTANQQNILIDTTPDLRSQIIRYNITKIDGVIITHDHADHIHGIDDLRPFCFFQEKKVIPLLTTPYTQQQLINRFNYIFNNKKKIIGGGIPRLIIEPVTKFLVPYTFGQEEFYFFTYPHGHIETLGLVHQQMAYITDCHHLPSNILEFLKEQKLKLLIIDCTKRTPHSTHLHLEKTLEYIDYISPQKSRLIHLSHDFDHQQLTEELQKISSHNTAPTFDGEELEY